MPEPRKLRVFPSTSLTVRAASNGGTPVRDGRAGFCHASQDKPIVRELYQKLHAEGWMKKNFFLFCAKIILTCPNTSSRNMLRK